MLWPSQQIQIQIMIDHHNSTQSWQWHVVFIVKTKHVNWRIIHQLLMLHSRLIYGVIDRTVCHTLTWWTVHCTQKQTFNCTPSATRTVRLCKTVPHLHLRHNTRLLNNFQWQHKTITQFHTQLNSCWKHPLPSMSTRSSAYTPSLAYSTVLTGYSSSSATLFPHTTMAIKILFSYSTVWQHYANNVPTHVQWPDAVYDTWQKAEDGSIYPPRRFSLSTHVYWNVGCYL